MTTGSLSFGAGWRRPLLRGVPGYGLLLCNRRLMGSRLVLLTGVTPPLLARCFLPVDEVFGARLGAAVAEEEEDSVLDPGSASTVSSVGPVFLLVPCS